MNADLILFIRVTNHLEYLSTHTTMGDTRSRGVSSMSDLSDELNQMGIVPRRGYWTTRSLECFVSRIKKRYGADYLMSAADCRFIGAADWEWQSASTARELMRGLDVIPKRVRDKADIAGPRYISGEGENWLRHEEPDLLREHAALVRKIFSNPQLF